MFFKGRVKDFAIKISMITVIIFILGISCTVNNNTSKITILNKSDASVSNIKIGNTIICCYIAAGGSYEYYFSFDLKGKLTGNDVISAGYVNRYDNNKISVVRRDGEYNLLHTGYFFDCEIFKMDKKYYITLRCDKSGVDNNETGDEYVEDGYYND
jgi:hypothetical protein